MKKKRGMSLEEKRQVMLGLFKNDLSFFHYKEIEKYSVQHKISFMIVKEILEGLVADNFVETEKIGSSSFYWSLPSRVYSAKQKNLERLKGQIETLNGEIEATQQKIEENKALRKGTEERQKKLEDLDNLNKRIDECHKVLSKFEKNDPERYDKLKKDNKILIDLYENWTDNISTIEQWLRSKFPDVKIQDMFPELKELPIFD